jgi:hypothetical protein
MSSGPPSSDTPWKGWTIAVWIVAMIALVVWKWPAIHWFALPDTDDNLRFAQVRAWLDGQGWFDLRQYRLDPPAGASIHWSRLIDLPIAGIILLLQPLFGTIIAQKAAVAIAPMLPLGVALGAVALAARRLIAPAAFAFALLILLCGQNALGMWAPMRIDHHGWQLALLAVAVAGVADPRAARGGVTQGVATALSLAIGLEMLHYLALIGGATVLRWVHDPREARRMAAYGVALSGGVALAYLLFASLDNRLPRCDALSPVWLSVALTGGALSVALSFVRAKGLLVRLLLAALAGALLAGAYALAWPHCLGRLEGVSPELDKLWLSHVREARPVYLHGWRIALPISALPVMGVIGSFVMLWRLRGDARFPAWAVIALLAGFSTALLLWQTRAGPGAQVLAVPGAAALAWVLASWTRASRAFVVRIAGGVAVFLIASGLIVPLVVGAIPKPPPSKARKAVSAANRRCPTLPALRPIGALPAATILTMVDLGPRLIATTHHRAIAGPYHRNQAAILDIHHAFRDADPAVAQDVMRRHGATLLLICPGMSETTLYAVENPKGFYVQLRDGNVPAWLAPVPLPKESPYRLWRRID